ncbi:DUF3828 domain-containing protein [Xanthomarina sp. F2636L]|uniref:DUF3828 domain-containing protein n=1 Tax=Xanthomarina sp. F2636L TaxID=2996018 RepID=UPI00225E0376|nr:DUF3828 domain-containing protein [Xanthomarina sp. F2636L]MCX7549642.1 DUF3828 domain-containing protein [Xanthomarina sp. F2636L]
MRTLTIILLLTLFSCKQSVSKEKEVAIEQNQAELIALEFINNYVEFCNDRNTELGLTDWISKQPNISENFKNELKKISTEAEKNNPELGLGFDPIFDAQDYPDNGFELEKAEFKSEYITVKGKDWNDFKLKIKMERKNEQWLVNGVGIINMTENERVGR